MSDQPTNEPIPMEPEPGNPGGVAVETPSQAPAPNPNEVISQNIWETALNNWLGAKIRGTPVTEASQAWAHLSSVLPELKTFLEAELAKSP